MLKWHTSSLFVCGSQVSCLWFTWRTQPWDELASKTSMHKTSLLYSPFFSTSLSLSPSVPYLDCSHCLFWHFKKLCQFPVFSHPNKMFCFVLFSYPLHTLLFSAGTQKMIVAFGFVLLCHWMNWLFSTFHTQQSRLSSNIFSFMSWMLKQSFHFK